MKAIYKIIQGNDFSLCVSAKRVIGKGTEAVSFADVTDISVTITKAFSSTRIPAEYEVNEDGDLVTVMGRYETAGRMEDIPAEVAAVKALLREGDKLIYAGLLSGASGIDLNLSDGKKKIRRDPIPVTGRRTYGVRGVKLPDDLSVVSITKRK